MSIMKCLQCWKHIKFKIKSLKSSFDIPGEKKLVTAVEGGVARLPCETKPPNNMRDRIKLVLWFKNDSAIPIYT